MKKNSNLILISLVIIFVFSCTKNKNSREEKKSYDIKYHIDYTSYVGDSKGNRVGKFFEIKVDTINYTGYIMGWMPESTNTLYTKTLILDSINAILVVYTDPLGNPFDSNYVKIKICKYVLQIGRDSTIVPILYECKDTKECMLDLYTKKERKYWRGHIIH